WSFDRPDLARLVRDAVRAVMADGILTADLAGPEGPPPATTDQFVDALVAVIHEVAKPVAGVGGRA
ncbi:MAG: hypothetical protein JOZ41_15580, partial [Chloroflexi bacterium]|nr:hypothetical protein [Chloroflexota bacterium]